LVCMFVMLAGYTSADDDENTEAIATPVEVEDVSEEDSGSATNTKAASSTVKAATPVPKAPVKPVVAATKATKNFPVSINTTYIIKGIIINVLTRAFVE